MLGTFLDGAIMICFWVAGLFFLRFWWQTRDRLFAYFALAFWMMAANRIVLSFLLDQSEARTYVYLVRLAAFLLILYAIFDKNYLQRRG